MQGLRHTITTGNDQGSICEGGDDNSDKLAVSHVLIHDLLAVNHSFHVSGRLVYPSQLQVEKNTHFVHSRLLLLIGCVHGLCKVTLLLVLLGEKVWVDGLLHLLGHASD